MAVTRKTKKKAAEEAAGAAAAAPTSAKKKGQGSRGYRNSNRLHGRPPAADIMAEVTKRESSGEFTVCMPNNIDAYNPPNIVSHPAAVSGVIPRHGAGENMVVLDSARFAYGGAILSYGLPASVFYLSRPYVFLT